MGLIRIAGAVVRLAGYVLLLAALSSCGGGGGDDAGAIQPVLLEPGAMPNCEAPDRPSLASGYAIANPFPTLGTVNVPTMATQHPAHPGRWYMVRQTGQIIYFEASDPRDIRDYLDFRDVVLAPEADKRGRALGLAFHPDYPATPELFVYYTGSENGVFSAVIKRVTLDDLDQPQAPGLATVMSYPIDSDEHQGGDLKFGPDGYLYLSLGDDLIGGPRRAQDTTHLSGSMLRLDVSLSGPGYQIPDGNPFADNPLCDGGIATGESCPEIYAWGFRNPYRWSFDPSGRLWLGDVGGSRQEEINWVEAGKNYGWGCYEGSLSFVEDACDEDDELEFPVFEYSHDTGDQAVLGGEYYTGAIPSLQGRYVYADIVSGRVWALSDDGRGNLSQELIADTPFLLSDMATGLDGELYFVARNEGELHKLVADDAGYIQTIPSRLTDTSCVNPADPVLPAAALSHYEINAPFWSDGAVKSRYVNLPEGALPVSLVDDELEFPIGTVLMKNFELAGQLIETRLFMRHTDGVWAGYTWEWNDDQTEAYRVIGGKRADKDGEEWIYPSEAQCMVCHNAAAGFTLGPEGPQLNRELPDAVGGVVNQLSLLADAGVLEPVPSGYDVARMADYLDTGESLDARARAWLDSNCAGCHRDEGFTPSSMDLRFNVNLADTQACDAEPGFGDLGLDDDARIIAPGDPDNSVLLERMSRRDEFGMPPLGSNLIDPVGVPLVRDWIQSLSGCL